MRVVVLQIFLNPYTYAQNKELIEYSRQNGILTEAYSALMSVFDLCSLASGLLTHVLLTVLSHGGAADTSTSPWRPLLSG